MEYGLHSAKTAYLSMEKAARRDRARGLSAIRIPRDGGNVPPAIAVGLGSRSWKSARSRLLALRHLRGRGR